MLFQPAILPIFEHDSATTRSITGMSLGAGVHQGYLDVSPLRAAGAIAKTIYADPMASLSDKVKLSCQAFLQVHSLSRPDKLTNNLRLCARTMHSRYGLRDFSRGSRVGEYGQGVCALFMQDYLKLPIVLDFGILCDLLNVPFPQNTDVKPDFAGWNGGSYKLVESKSSFASTSKKTELREGLLQCDAGAKYLSAYKALKPSGSFAVLTSFQPNSGRLESKLQFADPTDDGDEAPPEVHDQVAKYYYRCALEAFGMGTDQATSFLQKPLTGEQTERALPGVQRDLVPVPTADLPPFIEETRELTANYAFEYQMYVDQEVLAAIRSGSPQDYRGAIEGWSGAVREIRTSTNSPWAVWSDGLVMRLNAEKR